MKLEFNFNDLFPECSIVSISFAENPAIELSVRVCHKKNLKNYLFQFCFLIFY